MFSVVILLVGKFIFLLNKIVVEKLTIIIMQLKSYFPGHVIISTKTELNIKFYEPLCNFVLRENVVS